MKLVLVTTMVVAGGVSHASAQSPLVEQAPVQPVRRVYRNLQYGYSIRVPVGLRAYRMKSPLPQHGIAVAFKAGGNEMVWANAEYDAALLGSVDALAKRAAAAFIDSDRMTVVKITRSQLSKLDARTVVLERRGGAGTINYAALIVALRPMPGEVGIVYTVGIKVTQRRPAADAAFSQMVSSFRLSEVGVH